MKRAIRAVLVVGAGLAVSGQASCRSMIAEKPRVEVLADENQRISLELHRARQEAEELRRSLEAAEAARRAAEERAAAEVERIEEERRRVEEALTEDVRRGDVAVGAGPEGVTITLADAILFDVGSFEIKAEARSILDDVATALTRPDMAGRRVRISGHTDDLAVRPNPRFHDNWDLSARRAAAVARRLIERGVDAGRIEIAGFADRRPVAPNDSPANRARNRRVEILLVR